MFGRTIGGGTAATSAGIDIAALCVRVRVRTKSIVVAAGFLRRAMGESKRVIAKGDQVTRTNMSDMLSHLARRPWLHQTDLDGPVAERRN